ncbi:G-type lectin S-receptor-like serine/threonine-protein kinase [Ananas comosus]|uniref:Receptor-like serine/threonine-protein kinase n=1 Tax=Ananas comosus TaxID=4615 RepID=A0A199W3M8_ANACO|nr:G-type lectin S-receptor-like serine/threonine-protein kinase [Ananas comosus]
MAYSISIYSCSILLSLLFSLYTNLSTASDTISPSQSLSGNNTIVSKNGNFELGFFSPSNTSNYYIGIWFKKVPGQTIIWVANRENPVSDSFSSELKIAPDGNLVLLDESKLQIWSSNSTQKPTNSSTAVLLDTGNLILRSPVNSSEIIWQSFDHPTDTSIAGEWIGINKITGEYQSHVLWKDPDDPSLGPYTHRIDPFGSGHFVLLWNKSKIYWDFGEWTGNAFTMIPGMPLNTDYSYTFVNNSREEKFRWDLRDKSIVTRVVMSVNGQMQRHTWSESIKQWVIQWSMPADLCSVYAVCGSFGVCDTNGVENCNCLPGFEPASSRNWDLNSWSSGCVRKTSLKCSNKTSVNEEQDGFLLMSNMGLPEDSETLKVESVEECESACLNSCSCTAYAYESGCLIWNGELRNLKRLSVNNTEAMNLHLRLAAAELASQSTKNKRHIAIMLVAIGGALMILCIALVLAWRCYAKRLKRRTVVTDGSLKLFEYDYLRRCTDNFSKKLGKGSFGSVFKGELPASTLIAVKKLEGFRQGEKQFRTEVATLGAIQHVNLVRLRGFCFKGAERILVYDYMPNGSLDSHLFTSDSKSLDWKARFRIILGVAKALAYLHEECRECIIHCDIKPENVLVDSDFSPKVADFGMAKLIDRNFDRALTTARGTLGYLAPEWILGLPITPKADVYSYGMMLFEIISGRRNTEPLKDGRVGYFPLWAATNISEGEVLTLLDERLQGEVDTEEFKRACRIACWCIQDGEAIRPTMVEIVRILEGVKDIGVAPIPRSLQQLVNDQYLSTYSTS